MRTKTFFTIIILFFLTSCQVSCLPSTIDVGCNTAELIAAINDANANSNLTTLNLAQDCDYYLTVANNFIDRQETFTGEDGGTGLPPVTTRIIIEGHNATILRHDIPGTPDFRIFFVASTGELTLNDVTIKNGSIQGNMYNVGGGIYLTGGALTLNKAKVIDNFAEEWGGGISIGGGTLTIKNSAINNNYRGGLVIGNSSVLIEKNSQINNNTGGGITISSGDLTIQNSQINHNQSSLGGAGILFRGGGGSTLTLEDVLFEGNVAEGPGGALSMSDTAFTITGCTFSKNAAVLPLPDDSTGGAIHIRGKGGTISDSHFEHNSTYSYGGAIWINATNGELVTIQNSTIQYNSAELSGGGIGFLEKLAIINSTISGNTTLQDGGGIFNDQGELTVEGSIISENTANRNGGGIITSDGDLTITGSTIQRNQTPGQGGGIYAVYGTVSITSGSLIDGNTAQGDGGGIFNGIHSTLLMEESTVSNNHTAGFGGGIMNERFGHITISTSTISGNTTDKGGAGIDNFADLLIYQSLISGNVAAIVGGGIGNSANLTLVNSTVSGNQADSTSGVLVNFDTIIVHSTIVNNTSLSSSGDALNVHRMATLEIKNSIVALNSPSDCDFNGTVLATGENLDSDGTCTGFTVTADPLIGPLADNSGPTFTHALLSGSPALDVATDCTDTTLTPILHDQRFASRPGGPECDLGAYEDSTIFVPPPPPIMLITPTRTVYWCEEILGISILESGLMRIQISTPKLPEGTYDATVGKYEFTCKTYFDEYPGRLFCDGPKGEPGTYAALIVFDPLGIPFCEETISIPIKEKPEEPVKEPKCSKYLVGDHCLADPACTWDSGEGKCINK